MMSGTARSAGARSCRGTFLRGDQLDLILQPKLAPFQSSEFELISRAGGNHRLDLLVELTMLTLERIDPQGRFVVVHSLAGAFTANGAGAQGAGLHGASGEPNRSRETKQENRDLLDASLASMKGMRPMEKAQAEALESKHAALHALIDEEEHRPHPDEDLLHRLKKEKLKLKDELLGH